MFKQTKIVATIGPATEHPTTIKALIEAGVNVFRLNMSHGTKEEHLGRLKNVRQVAKKLNQSVGVLIDLCGPKIRTGDFEGGKTTLVAGKTFTFTTDAILGDATRASISYKKLPKEVAPGCRIMLDDGRRILTVQEVRGNEIVCRIDVGGDIKDRRGVNVPDAKLSIDCVTAKDRSDLLIATAAAVDFVALSFVQTEEDIKELRSLMQRHHIDAKIIAKIETAESIKHLAEIVDVADGVMVARGDLAVEVSPEEVPLVQKRLIELANAAGKPVITATQMLDSMTQAPVPTRAEVSDIANAILDGTDAVMLSNETAVGSYPVEAVSVMSRVATRLENDYLHRKIKVSKRTQVSNAVTDAVTAAAVLNGETLQAKAIIALTMSGRVARMIARHKPDQPIYAFSPNEKTCQSLALSFGVKPILIQSPKHFNDVLPLVRKVCLQQKLVKKGDRVIVVCGLPFGKVIDANLMLVEQV